MGTFAIWVVVTPQFTCKKVREEHKRVEQKLCNSSETKISGIEIGWDLWTLGDGDPRV